MWWPLIWQNNVRLLLWLIRIWPSRAKSLLFWFNFWSRHEIESANLRYRIVKTMMGDPETVGQTECDLSVRQRTAGQFKNAMWSHCHWCDYLQLIFHEPSVSSVHQILTWQKTDHWSSHWSFQRGFMELGNGYFTLLPSKIHVHWHNCAKLQKINK